MKNIILFQFIFIGIFWSYLCLKTNADGDGDLHMCDRQCSPDEPPKTCHYKFTMEWYQTFTKACYDCPYVIEDCHRPECIHTAGVVRPITVINKMLPGPKIQVCQNDTVVVDVYNNMANEEAITIHWHGQHMFHSPHMDGVSMLTQCPIHRRTTFRYKFKAETPGTHFWHSHAGQQRGDGATGMLVVRQNPSEDPHFNLYDHDLPEHQIMVQDWIFESANDRYISHHYSNGDNKPRTLIINGKGRFRPWTKENSNKSHFTPLEKFKVTQGQRYRFRLVSNGMLNSPLVFSIDGHKMLVISSDGTPFEPVLMDTLVIYAGERFDFILNATSPRDNYWVRLYGLIDGKVFNTSQLAVLSYEGTSDDEPTGPDDYDSMYRQGKQLNPLNALSSENKTSIADMKSLLKIDPWLTQKPDYKFYLAFDFYERNGNEFHDLHHYRIEDVSKLNKLFFPLVNNISNMLPSSPLLSQPHDVDPELICHDTAPVRACNARDRFCSCTHVLKVKLNSIVEIFVIDEGFMFNTNHPFHLHGHNFYVVGMDIEGTSVTRDHVIAKDNAGNIARNFDRPILKDTITVPDGGYTILKFKAKNAGFWLFHCHIQFHGEIGMSVIFQVGDVKEHPKPPDGFHKCGNYLPPIAEPKPVLQVKCSSINLQKTMNLIILLLISSFALS